MGLVQGCVTCVPNVEQGESSCLEMGVRGYLRRVGAPAVDRDGGGAPSQMGLGWGPPGSSEFVTEALLKALAVVICESTVVLRPVADLSAIFFGE